MDRASAVLRFVDSEALKPWVLAILGLVLVTYLITAHFSRSRLPPGPLNLPLIGAMLSMESNTARCFTKLARKYGPIFYCRLGAHRVIVVSSAERAEEVLKTKDSEFGDRPVTTLMKSGARHVGFGGQDMVFGRTHDNNWKKLKDAVVTSLLSPAKLAAFENIRRREGVYLVEEILSRSAGSGVNVDLRELLSAFSINSVGTAMCGQRYSDAILSKASGPRHYPYIMTRATVVSLQFNVEDLFPWLGWTSYIGLDASGEAFHQLCRDCVGETVEEHRLARKSDVNYKDRDWVDFLLTLHERGEISEDTVYGCVVDFVVGGMDTNSVTTEWAMLELVKNPETLTKLQKEIDEVVGRDRPVEESDFANMPYLQAVIKETFRLHPPAPILAPHFNKSASSLGGFYVPANTTVFVNMFGIGRDTLLWENPEQFNPSRFLGSRHANVKNVTGSAFEVLPFSRGKRMCPGYRLGLLLVQRSLTTLVHAFDWSPPVGMGVNSGISSEEKAGLVYRPHVPLVLSATARLAPTVYTT